MIMKEKRVRLVPYEMLKPGWEAVYTGEKSDEPIDKIEIIWKVFTDGKGNVIKKWSTWTWTFPGQEADWDEEIKHINGMQANLRSLSDEVRKIRAHITSLIPCEAGFPVTVDEILDAIGKGRLPDKPFHAGCWAAGMWWNNRNTQHGQPESIQIIEDILRGYLEGKGRKDLLKRFPHAEGVINHTYEWLGPRKKLTHLQELMIERMLLPFDYFTRRNPDYVEVGKESFEEGGRGVEIDKEIERLADLPNINVEWSEYCRLRDSITDPDKKELYRLCRSIRSSVYGLSDCSHQTFRFIENWVWGIGSGKLGGIPTRIKGTERTRLGRLLFGYVLALDKWLTGIPMQFLLLDLGHIDLGFDPKNEILRAYAYLGEERTPIKEWLVACLWHNLMYNSIVGNPGGLVRHKDLLELASRKGISLREWIDGVLERKNHQGR
jgi:hypothetical protein